MSTEQVPPVPVLVVTRETGRELVRLVETHPREVEGRVETALRTPLSPNISSPTSLCQSQYYCIRGKLCVLFHKDFKKRDLPCISISLQSYSDYEIFPYHTPTHIYIHTYVYTGLLLSSADTSASGAETVVKRGNVCIYVFCRSIYTVEPL